MGKILEKLIGSIEIKKEWKAIEKQSEALPKDYRIAYDEIKQYIWRSSGVYTIEPFRILINLFVESAANGTPVQEVIGNDVAAFVDELVRGEKSYFEDLRKKLNNDIAKKLEK
jgi:DNA-binding ferritin-like protein (Dps family)